MPAPEVLKNGNDIIRPAERVPRVLIAALLIAFVLVGGILVLQRAILYPGQARAAAPDAILRHPRYEQIWLETQFGPVEAWYQPARGRTAAATAATGTPAILFAHGNGELIDDWPDALAPFADMGAGLMLVEFPNFGRSAGTASQANVEHAMRAAIEALSARPDVDPGRIVLYGRSLGGGAVSTLLDHHPPAALILQSTFTSVVDMAWQTFKMPSFLVRDPYRSLDALERYDGPVLVIHGDRDTLIPPSHGAALAAASRRAELITYECGHNDCPPNWPRFFRDIESFLLRAGVLP